MHIRKIGLILNRESVKSDPSYTQKCDCPLGLAFRIPNFARLVRESSHIGMVSPLRKNRRFAKTKDVSMTETDHADPCILTLEIERKTDEAVVRLQGKLIAEVSGNFYYRLRQLAAENKRIVLDLGDVIYIDSMGLGTLVRLLVSAKTKGCSLELLNVGKRVRQILGLTNVLGCFTIIGEQGITPRF